MISVNKHLWGSMQNKLFAILASILCGTAPLVAQEEVQRPKTEQSQSNFKLGKETVSTVRTAYGEGEYNSFFGEMDASYKEALSENGLETLVQIRSEEADAALAAKKWEEKALKLQNEKNKELLSLVPEKDDSVFAQKVRSVVANPSTPEQDKAISELHRFIQMAPNSGKNDDENKLISIDVEYEYKLLHLTLPTTDLSNDEIAEKRIALRMEKMDKMIAASKSFQDHALKQAVGLAAANLDARMARNLDGTDLNALVRGKVKPANELETQVYSVLSTYQEKFSELLKEIADGKN